MVNADQIENPVSRNLKFCKIIKKCTVRKLFTLQLGICRDNVSSQDLRFFSKSLLFNLCVMHVTEHHNYFIDKIYAFMKGNIIEV
jgi:hypothetical protein